MAKIELRVTFQNADTKESFELDCPLEGNEPDLVEAETSLAAAGDIPTLATKLEEVLAKDSRLYKHFLSVFVWKGHDKTDWDDVTVLIRGVTAGDVNYEVYGDVDAGESENPEIEIQLVKSPDGAWMYFL